MAPEHPDDLQLLDLQHDLLLLMITRRIIQAFKVVHQELRQVGLGEVEVLPLDVLTELNGKRVKRDSLDVEQVFR